MPSPFFEEYKETKANIKALEKSTKDVIGTLILAILMSVLIVAGPIALFINLVIFVEATFFINIGLIGSCFLLIFLPQVFYYQGITKNQVINMRPVYTMSALIALIVTCFVFFILIVL